VAAVGVEDRLLPFAGFSGNGAGLDSMGTRIARAPRARRQAWLALLPLLVAGQPACHREEPSSPPSERAAAANDAEREEIPGRWRKLRPRRVDENLSQEQRERIARLEAIGYLSGSVEAPQAQGVTVHRATHAYQGLNFFSSGHAPEAILMDMDGTVLHRWRHDFLDIWPDYPKDWLHTGAGFWRRAYLYENGDILAIFEGMGIIKLDKDSKLIWASPVKAHHDLQVMPDGDIYVLTRQGHVVPRVDPEQPILEDFVSILDADGHEKKRVSVLESFERSEFNHYWNADQVRLGDLFHTNSVNVLDGRIADAHPVFARGNVLTSMLMPDTIAVLDLEEEKIVWAWKGAFKKQHDPKILENGRLLLFDNRGADGRSRVLELDLANPDRVAWQYGGSEETPLFSFTCGAAERLPNGNTLITESDGGRAFEVTPQKEIVWEFYNPHRAGDDGEFIATLFELLRLPPDFPSEWAEHSPGVRAGGG
jgi:hypothetical protein